MLTCSSGAWASVQIWCRPTMSTMLYLLIAFGILALMLAGNFLIRPRKHDTQINIDFDAKKSDENNHRF